jgi:hypothetical protein
MGLLLGVYPVLHVDSIAQVAVVAFPVLVTKLEGRGECLDADPVVARDEGDRVQQLRGVLITLITAILRERRSGRPENFLNVVAFRFV